MTNWNVGREEVIHTHVQPLLGVLRSIFLFLAYVINADLR